jgi:hypothetical protein
VPCHANPGPPHTFVKSDNRFSGVIDFGDAYISHPVFDIRRWPTEDREAIIEGYRGKGDVDNSTMTVFNVADKLDSIVDHIKRERQRVPF